MAKKKNEKSEIKKVVVEKKVPTVNYEAKYKNLEAVIKKAYIDAGEKFNITAELMAIMAAL